MNNTTFTEFATNAIFRIGASNDLTSFDSPERIGYYTFIWAMESEVEIVVDSEPVRLLPNQILALTPIQYFQFVSGEGLRVYQFNREFYCIKDHDKTVGCAGDLFFGNDYIPVVSLAAEEVEKFELLHQIFLEEMNNKDRVQAEMLRMLLARFIIKTTRLLNQADHPQQIKKKSDLLRKFNMLVELHFKEQHGVKFYAEQMFKSPKTLANSFSKFNNTPLQIIHQRIVLEAKRLLTYSDLSSKEIAYELGFDDPAHLSKLFKKHTGMPPSAFKANHIHTLTQ